MGTHTSKHLPTMTRYGSINSTKYQKLNNESSIPWLMPTMYRYHDAVINKKYNVRAEIENMFDLLGMSLLLDMYHYDNSMLQ